MAEFLLEVYTPEKKQYDEYVSSVQAPGADGYLGVLAHHAPLLTMLGEGKLTIRRGNQTSEFRLSGGFLEVHDNRATILADEFGPWSEGATAGRR